MFSLLRISACLLLIFTVVTGVIYPAFVTLLAQSLFPNRSQGSLIYTADQQIQGSSLLGQEFTDAKYFWGRLSATAPAYNPAASSGSNLGINAAALKASAEARIAALRQHDPDQQQPIPVDLVTASGSGLDPHISPAAATYQIARVAKVRGLSAEAVTALLVEATEQPQLGFLGEARVNVLRLNLALDALDNSAP